MRKIFYSFAILCSILLIGFSPNITMAQDVEVAYESDNDGGDLFVAVLFGVALFLLIVFFATWGIIKFIFHKKHPMLIGTIVVIVFVIIFYSLYYRMTFL